MRTIEEVLRDVVASFTLQQWVGYCGLSPQYPADIKPVREGVYVTSRVLSSGASLDGYSYWNGNAWASQYMTPESAYKYRTHITPNTDQNKRWRGLAKEPKL